MSDLVNKHPRVGKTAKDRLTGAWAQHQQNQEARRQWNREYAESATGGGLKVVPYPKIGK